MSAQIALEQFTTAFHLLLEETFERVHGAYLDGGTSLFETLATVGGAMATLAHTAYHLGEIRQALCTVRR